MRYVCAWSGGKDSTANILLARLYNEPLDTIICSEVMFDKEKGISGENPRHIDFIYNKAKPIFESWGYEVLILRAEKDYLDVFNRVIENPRKHPEHKGMKYGFCISGLCSIKRDCKMKPIQDYYKTLNEEVIEYVGICVDEPERLASMHKNPNKISLLEKYGYTQDNSRDLCDINDLLSPSYEMSKRGGCWFCPNAKLCEHRYIKENMPDVWDRFIALENEPNIAHDKWNSYTGETLAERNEKLKYKQLHIMDFIS